MPGIKGEVSNVSGVTFTYQEQSYGTNRGIKVWISGNNAICSYRFTPNPHNADSKWYNKNQPEFYRLAAKEIAEYHTQHAGWPPDSTNIQVNNTTYKLEARG